MTVENAVCTVFAEVHITVRAVSVQHIIVSKKTSAMLHIPCNSGLSLSAELCRIGELPKPASFENIPRLIPIETAFEIVYPDTPPANCLIPNA